MNKYINFFPFQYKKFDICFQKFWLALDHYNAHIMDKKHDESITFRFSQSTTKIEECAYLMPIRNAKSKEGTQLAIEEVEERKLQ